MTALSPLAAAALKLAAAHPWPEVTLAMIAAEAGVPLAALAGEVRSKADLLRRFSREMDRALVASLDGDPIEGEPHDRLFDAMLRRLELMTPHKAGIAGIAAAPAEGPADWVALCCSALETQGWILAAAKIDARGLEGDMHRLGLARIEAQVLRVWLADDDPGLARTMAALDRKLRDGAEWARRLETPFSILSALLRAARAFRERGRETAADHANATAD